MEITVDVESDWGGRTDTLRGITKGIPFILHEIEKRGLKGIFFLSTQYLHKYADYAMAIKQAGHTIGNHGNKHVVNPEKFWDEVADAERRINCYLDCSSKYVRAPKFSCVIDTDKYSSPKNHVGLLRSVWFGTKPNADSILYLHPFDLVKPTTKAPNLMCKLWYSRYEEARLRFTEFLDFAVSNLRTV